MNPPCEKKKAIDELLSEDTPDGYYETLSQFYEAWNSSALSDGTTPDQRSIVLTHFKALRRFLFRLHKQKYPNSTATPETWLG